MASPELLGNGLKSRSVVAHHKLVRSRRRLGIAQQAVRIKG
jgi:hypothetical protein